VWRRLQTAKLALYCHKDFLVWQYSKPRVQINGQIQSLHNFQQKFAPSVWKNPKTQSWGPLANWKFAKGPPTHWPHHQYTHRTGQKTMYGFIMACIKRYATGQNSLSHWRVRIWLPMAFKKFSPKTQWSRAQFRKVSQPLAKIHMLFPAHLWVREFWPQIYSLWLALDWVLLSKILASMKMGRPRMPKGQLPRVGQRTLGCCSLSSLLFGCFSSPTNIHPHSSYSHWTSTLLHSICFMNSFHFFLFLSLWGFLQVLHGRIKAPKCTL